MRPSRVFAPLVSLFWLAAIICAAPSSPSSPSPAPDHFLQKDVMDLLDPTHDPLALSQIRGVLMRLEDTIIFCSIPLQLSHSQDPGLTYD
jgi:hypothetical protein